MNSIRYRRLLWLVVMLALVAGASGLAAMG